VTFQVGDPFNAGESTGRRSRAILPSWRIALTGSSPPGSVLVGTTQL